jgi:hypothetical protein
VAFSSAYTGDPEDEAARLPALQNRRACQLPSLTFFDNNYFNLNYFYYEEGI